MIVHLCLWSSQPDLYIACDLSWTTPAWKQPELPEGVHLANDRRLYTFEEEKTTCQACRETAADPAKRHRAGHPGAESDES